VRKDVECLVNAIDETKGCVTLWPRYLQKYLKAKKNYGDSNISPCQNTIFKKSL
jgi:hypothetical protein